MAQNHQYKSSLIFTESTRKANSVYNPQCPSVLCAIAENQIPRGLLVEECFANKSCFSCAAKKVKNALKLVLKNEHNFPMFDVQI